MIQVRVQNSKHAVSRRVSKAAVLLEEAELSLWMLRYPVLMNLLTRNWKMIKLKYLKLYSSSNRSSFFSEEMKTIFKKLINFERCKD